ncbi:hypothetical protein D9757_010023 [Collybiopsis confluens]|uniref:Uncharacterized protein n=1 Tax=Collybiopsis confluens TaxID=2823264 RepID=A0A8H5GQN3_9AGAR|nr:hypothetical protein D9757_010023 [Collybiopsis confluens]
MSANDYYNQAKPQGQYYPPQGQLQFGLCCVSIAQPCIQDPLKDRDIIPNNLSNLNKPITEEDLRRATKVVTNLSPLPKLFMYNNLSKARAVVVVVVVAHV